jgi:endonuclease YncB( thermonuclease family)
LLAAVLVSVLIAKFDHLLPDFRRLGPPAVVPADQLYVIDGDTVALDAERIRILGVDAPELDGACEEERQRALAAQAYLRDLLWGAEASLERLPEPDAYGRTLAVLRVGGRDVADLLLAAGHGRRGLAPDWCP